MQIKSRVQNFLSRFERKFEPMNIIEVSRSRLLYNFDNIEDRLFKKQIFPVLKSNAYGHDIQKIAEILKEREFPYIVVDGYYEALKVWEVSNHEVLLMGYSLPWNLKKMKFRRCAITVFDIETVKALSKIDQKIKIHIKVDTGMNRQGVKVDDLNNFLEECEKYQNIKIEGLCSHLADADNQDRSFTELQISKYKKAREIFDSKKIDLKYSHLGASSASLRYDLEKSNVVRTGLALYGINPVSEDNNDHENFRFLKPVLRFKSKIYQIKNLKKGDCVGYGCTHTATENMRIGLIPAGYFEGINRKLSNRGYVKTSEESTNYQKYIGKICMNLSCIDITDSNIEKYDDVVVISWESEDKNSVRNIVKQCNLIPYNVLSNLASATRRIIVD